MYDEGDFDYYFFDKNIFGDIVGIYNENGRKICTYTYDAWGVCETTLSSGISSTERAVADQYNPFTMYGVKRYIPQYVMIQLQELTNEDTV